MIDYEDAVVFFMEEHGWSQRGDRIGWHVGRNTGNDRMKGTQINFWARYTRVGVTIYFPEESPHIIHVMPIHYKYSNWVYDHYGAWRTDFRSAIEVNLMHPTSLQELSEYVDNLMMSQMDWFERLGFKFQRWWYGRLS